MKFKIETNQGQEVEWVVKDGVPVIVKSQLEWDAKDKVC